MNEFRLIASIEQKKGYVSQLSNSVCRTNTQTRQPGWGQLLETGKWGKKIARANHFGAKGLHM